MYLLEDCKSEIEEDNVFLARKLPIRLFSAKVANLRSLKISRAQRKSRSMEVKKTVTQALRKELSEIKRLITDACSSGKFQIKYTAPTHMTCYEVQLLFAKLEDRLLRSGYRVDTSNRDMMVFWNS